MTLKEIDEHGGQIVLYKGALYCVEALYRIYVPDRRWQVKLRGLSASGNCVVIARAEDIEEVIPNE